MSLSFNTANQGLGGAGAAKPGFSSFSFGQPTATASPFGAPVTSIAPSFGAQPSFGSTGFGTTSTAPTSFSFGQTATTSAAPGGFGGGFGTSLSTPASTGFGGFGTGAFGNSFGTTTTTSSAPAFTGFGQPAASSFGQTNTSTFGKPNFMSSGFSFNSGQTQQPQLFQQPQPVDPDDAFAQSIFNVAIYGDERDTILAKWNYLQAMWGIGKSFYNNTAPIDITPQNFLCRFKAMGYNRLPCKENKMGFVALVVDKPISQIQGQIVVQNLNAIFGNKPQLSIIIESIAQEGDTRSQIIFYVEEKSQISNETKRYTATEVATFLNQPNNKQSLATSLNVQNIFPFVIPDEDQLKEYNENPPKGVDPRMWRQAKLDNPDPLKFLPVPIIGFCELNRRIRLQEQETDIHVKYLAKVEKDIAELKHRHANSTAKIMEHRRKFAELSHRILKIIVKQEITRKVGVALSPEEEMLRSKMENMQALVSAPTQFKGRLSELLSQMRMQRNQWALTSVNEYTLDKDSSEEMKAFLTMQQKAMSFLIETVNKDMQSLKIISDGMSQLMRG